jgi:uncharacterized YigZ family protein
MQSFEIEVKRSRFLTSIASINNRAEGKRFIEQTRAKYPTASHHCWAYIAGPPDDAHQFDQSDDGEPKGTAGKPMLNVLQHSGLGNTIGVVSRYFGGIKLGSGGLVRAYTQSVSAAIKQLEMSEHHVTLPLNIRFTYSWQGKLDYYLSTEAISIACKTFDSDVSYRLAIPASRFSSIKAELLDLTQGQLTIENHPPNIV